MRPLRIDTPGSWHHLMNRGIARRSVFEDRAEVLEGPLGLDRRIAIDHLSGGGIDRDLTRAVDQARGHHRLTVGADGRRGRVGVQGLSIAHGSCWSRGKGWGLSPRRSAAAGRPRRDR